ncbi:hypothetical protein GBAR_LOCUS28157 [Geodia barretti]|uniref:Uncharacterized protein n=1 Tax=Geodia barretti TaxID=519541 RepID=A0AA35TNA7_GEOBA|nr:hypothetical protein GBAR_LOCUS28157 [Geodia barretti]
MTTAFCLKPQAIFFKTTSSLLKLVTVAHMEVKLGAHAYYIVSMTTTTTISLRHFSLEYTPSLLKLANCSTHGGETWCITSFL